MLGEAKLKISDVSRDTGINRGTLTRLYYETSERYDVVVLDQLCRYFNCKVGDLLEYVEGPQAQATPEAEGSNSA